MSQAFAVTKAVTSGVAMVAGIASHASAQDMNGFYAGLNLASPSGTFFDGSQDYGYEGGTVGGFAGYNFAQGDWVLGVEVAMVGDFDAAIGFTTSQNTALEGVTDIKARVGRMFGSTMVYGAIGMTSADLDWFNIVTEVSGTMIGGGVETTIGKNGFVGFDFTVRDFKKGTNVTYIDAKPFTTASIRAGFRF